MDIFENRVYLIWKNIFIMDTDYRVRVHIKKRKTIIFLNIYIGFPRCFSQYGFPRIPMTVHQNTKLFTNSQFSWHRYGCRQACVDHLLHVKSFIVPPVPHKVIMHFLVSINHKRINFNLIMCVLYILSYTIIFIVFFFLLSLIKMVSISMPNSYFSFFFLFFSLPTWFPKNSVSMTIPSDVHQNPLLLFFSQIRNFLDKYMISVDKRLGHLLHLHV